MSADRGADASLPHALIVGDAVFKRTASLTWRTARRVVIAVMGTTVVLLGVAMLVLPGPGLLTIIGGLALLGLEFAFARRWLARLRESARSAARKVSQRGRNQPPAPGPPDHR